MTVMADHGNLFFNGRAFEDVDPFFVEPSFYTHHVGMYSLHVSSASWQQVSATGELLVYRRADPKLPYGVLVIGDQDVNTTLITLDAITRLYHSHRSVHIHESSTTRFLLVFASHVDALDCYQRLVDYCERNRTRAETVDRENLMRRIRGLAVYHNFLDHISTLLGGVLEVTDAIELDLEETMEALVAEDNASGSGLGVVPPESGGPEASGAAAEGVCPESGEAMITPPAAAEEVCPESGEVFARTPGPNDASLPSTRETYTHLSLSTSRNKTIPFKLDFPSFPNRLDIFVPALGFGLAAPFLPRSLFYLDLMLPAPRQPQYSPVVADLFVPTTVLANTDTEPHAKLFDFYRKRSCARRMRAMDYLDLAGLTHLRLRRELFGRAEIVSYAPCSGGDSSDDDGTDYNSSLKSEEVDFGVPSEEPTGEQHVVAQDLEQPEENRSDSDDDEDEVMYVVDTDTPPAQQVFGIVGNLHADHRGEKENPSVSQNLDEVMPVDPSDVATTSHQPAPVQQVFGSNLPADHRGKKENPSVSHDVEMPVDPSDVPTTSQAHEPASSEELSDILRRLSAQYTVDSDDPASLAGHVIDIMRALNANCRRKRKAPSDSDDSTMETRKPALNIEVTADVHLPDTHPALDLMQTSYPDAEGVVSSDQDTSSVLDHAPAWLRQQQMAGELDEDKENRPNHGTLPAWLRQQQMAGEMDEDKENCPNHGTLPDWLRQQQMSGDRIPMSDLEVELGSSSDEEFPQAAEPGEPLVGVTPRSALGPNLVNIEDLPRRPPTRRRSWGKENCPPFSK